MNAVGATLTVLMGLVVVFTPRRWAALALMAAVCYITQGQQVVVMGFHFTAIRVVLLAGLLRTLGRGELRRLELNQIDWALIIFTAASTVLPPVRVGTSDELVYQFGFAYNTLLSYFVFRPLVTTFEDAKIFVGDVALLILPLALCMVVESVTGRSVFNFMGGREQEVDWFRAGRYRCVGSFRGPHTAGTFGATLLPLFGGLVLAAGRRGVAVAGLIAAAVITYTANASGSSMAFLSSLIALAFWPLRKDMKRVRWGIVALLVGLALAMKAPIWYIFAKISALTGGDGYTRSYVLESCYNHFFDWWLLGTSNTSGWGVIDMATGGADITDQYVSSACQGGLAALSWLVIILIRCFRDLGLSLHVARAALPGAEPLLWCFGCALFAHVVTLFSVTYFDQMHVAWWALLAIISSLTSDILKPDPALAAIESAQALTVQEATS